MGLGGGGAATAIGDGDMGLGGGGAATAMGDMGGGGATAAMVEAVAIGELIS